MWWEAVIDVQPAALDAAAVDPVVRHTMRWSAEYAVACVSPETGAVLRLLADASRSRAVIEVGTGLGVSGLWLLAGLPPEAILTSIDIDADLQGMARQAYAAAGHAPGRFRLLAGRAEVLLGRLAEATYNLMFIDITDQRAVAVDAAARLLRPSGLLLVHHPTEDDRVRLRAPLWTAAALGPELLSATRAASPAAPIERPGRVS
jgi:predicted O-methyltransferase YrrM